MAQETILSLSLKEYKNEIESLRASLLGLERDSEAYQSTAEQVRNMQEKLNQVMLDSKKDTAALEGSYNALTQQMAQLKKEWKSTTNEARRNELATQISSTNEKLKELDASIGNYQRNVGQYEIAGQSMKSALREQQEQLAQLLMQGYSPASEEVQKLVQETGRLKDAIQTAKGMTSQYANDLQGLSTVLDVTKTAAAGYGAWQSALSMFGIESEETSVRIKKLMAAQTMLNSLMQFSKGLVDEESATYRVWNTIVQSVIGNKNKEVVAEQLADAAKKSETTTTKALSVAEGVASAESKGLAAAQTTVAASTNSASVAMNAFKAALVATGIGAFLVILGTLITKWDKLKESIFGARDALKSYNDLSSLSDNFKEYENEQARASARRIEILRAEGKEESEIIKEQQRYNSAMLDEVTARKSQLELKKQSKGLNEEEEKSLETLTNDFYELNERQADLNNSLEAYNVKKEREKNNRKESTKATKDSKDAWEDETNAIEKNLRRLSEEIRYRKELRNAQGKGSKEQDLNDELTLIDKQIESYQKLITVYNKYINDAKTSDEDKEKLKKELIKTEEQLDKSKNDKEIANARLTTNQLAEEYKKRKDAFSSYISYTIDQWQKVLFNNDFVSDQVRSSSLPVVNMIVGDPGDYKLSIENALAVLEGVKDKIFNEFDKLLVKSNGKGGFKLSDLFFDDENGEQQIDLSSLAMLRKYYQDIVNETKAFTSEQSKEKNDAQQALFVIDEVIGRQNFEAQLTAYSDYLKQIEDEYKKIEEKVTEGLSSDSNYADSDLGKQQLEDLKNKEAEAARIKMDMAKFVADYLIQQQNRVKDNEEDNSKRSKEYVESQVSAAASAAAAIGDLMQTVIDGRKQNLQSLYDEGKITEEELHKRFEDMKTAELATLWISTLAGATGAFLKDKETYPAPWNYIIGGIDFATTFAAGVAQHQAIKNQTWETASKGNGGVSSVSVSPLLNERLDMTTLSSINTEEIANNTGQDTRVYVLENDIQESNERVEIREYNTTF